MGHTPTQPKTHPHSHTDKTHPQTHTAKNTPPLPHSVRLVSVRHTPTPTQCPSGVRPAHPHSHTVSVWCLSGTPPLPHSVRPVSCSSSSNTCHTTRAHRLRLRLCGTAVVSPDRASW